MNFLRFLAQPATRCTRSLPHGRRWISARAILDDDTIPVDLSEDNDVVDGLRNLDRRSTHRHGPVQSPTPTDWRNHRLTLKEAFPDGWNPPKKLSRDAMDGLRQLHRVDPETFSTAELAARFRVSPEAVRRILKSRWAPSNARRAQIVRKEAEVRVARRSLSAVKERLETERVLESKRAMRDVRRRSQDEDVDDDGFGTENGDGHPVKGIHSRDRFAFE